MFNHEPENYECPFCELIGGKDGEINTKEHIVYEDKNTLAFVSPKWWINNPGSVLVVPKKHVENIYDISEKDISEVYKTAKKIAIAIRKTYKCTGISTRQHNESDGGQDVWHFHVHVFPRFKNDKLYQNHDKKEWVSNEQRMIYVSKLKNYFKTNEQIATSDR